MFKMKHIDVDNDDHIKLVRRHQVHFANPFVYRIECEREECSNTVWPEQMYDVRELDPALTGGASFVCDGCVEMWIRMPEYPLDVEKLMKANGATKAEIKAWKDKCEAAKPANTYES